MKYRPKLPKKEKPAQITVSPSKYHNTLVTIPARELGGPAFSGRVLCRIRVDAGFMVEVIDDQTGQARLVDEIDVVPRYQKFHAEEARVGDYGICDGDRVVYRDEYPLSELEADFIVDALNHGAGPNYDDAWEWVRHNRLACVCQNEDGTCGYINAPTPECHGAACSILFDMEKRREQAT